MILTLFKMSRPANILIAIVTLAIGYYLLGVQPTLANGISSTSLMMQSLAFAFAIAFANIQNDVLDINSDKINRPTKPLICGKITIKKAKIAYVILCVLSIICGILDSAIQQVNIFVALFFVALIILLALYNKILKHIPLVKNMTVAFFCTTPFILCLICPIGVIETEEFSLDYIDKICLLYPAALFAFLFTCAREIYKDLEDETGDLKAGIMTFPLIVGSKVANKLACFICIFCLATLILPVLQGYYPVMFLIISTITIMPIVAFTLYYAHCKNYKRAQRLLKVAMAIGLLALVVSC